MQPLRLLIVDDHPIVLAGLRLLLQADPRFEICAEAATPTEARRQAEHWQPELIVTDLVLGGADGVALIDDLLAAVPAALIVVYSSQEEGLWARHVLRAGARGYVSKAEPLDAVAGALDVILSGGRHFSAPVQKALNDDQFGQLDKAHDLTALSARELQVLASIGRGSSLQEMSQLLGLSVKTVGTYRERLKIKLGFDNARALELFAASQAPRA